MKKKKTVTVAFMGDAAVEEGIFAESLNFASLKKLPVLFVCENNLYSILTTMEERQPDREIYSYASSFAIQAFKGDGNNVTEVDKISKNAVDLVRNGCGPVFLEFLTYRHREHCGPNFEPEGWRPQEEVEEFMKKDPLKQSEGKLLDMKIISVKDVKVMRHKIKKEINEAFEFARKSPFPGSNFDSHQVYA